MNSLPDFKRFLRQFLRSQRPKSKLLAFLTQFLPLSSETSPRNMGSVCLASGSVPNESRVQTHHLRDGLPRQISRLSETQER